MEIFLILSVVLCRVSGLPNGHVHEWIKNQFCTGERDFFSLPWDCTGYLHCGSSSSHPHWTNCDPGMKFDMVNSSCRKVSSTCEDPEKVAATYCQKYPLLKFAHPLSCSMFYDCSVTVPKPGLKKYENECSPPYMFDHVNSVCREISSPNSALCTYIPSSSCDYIAAPNPSCQIKDQTCSGLPRGLHIDPMALATFIPTVVSCLKGKVVARYTCNAAGGEVFDVAKRVCTRDQTVAIKNFCEMFPTATFADPDMCAMYYNCSAKQHHNVKMEDYLTECKYIHLYDTKTRSCMRYNEVTTPCGTREEPLKPCEYRLGDCGGDRPCIPCSAICEGLPDGLNTYPKYKYTRFYLVCEGQRTLDYKECDPPLIFLPGRRICGKRGDDITPDTNTSNAEHCIGSRPICAADLRIMQEDMTELATQTKALEAKVNEKLPDPYECVTPPAVLNSVMRILCHLKISDARASNSSKLALKCSLSYTSDSARATYACKEGFSVCGEELVSVCSAGNTWSALKGMCMQSTWTDFNTVAPLYLKCPPKVGSVILIRGRQLEDSYTLLLKDGNADNVVYVAVQADPTKNLLDYGNQAYMKPANPGLTSFMQDGHEWAITVNKKSFSVAVEGHRVGVIAHNIDLDNIIFKLEFAGNFMPDRVQILHDGLPYDEKYLLSGNLALNQPVISSTGYKPQRVVDGDNRVQWAENSCWASKTGDLNPWLMVNLGNPFLVSRVAITTPDCQTDTCGTLHDFAIYVALEEIANLEEETLCFRYSGKVATNDVETITCNRPLIGQFVTIIRTSRYDDQEKMAMCEFEVYGGQIPQRVWSPFMCPDPPLAPHATVHVGYTETEAVATYTCKENYGICGGGKNVIRCNSEKGWFTRPKPCVRFSFGADWGEPLKPFPICPLHLQSGLELWFTPKSDNVKVQLLDKQNGKTIPSSLDINPFTKDKEAHMIIYSLSHSIQIEVDGTKTFNIPIDVSLALGVDIVDFGADVVMRKARIHNKMFGVFRDEYEPGEPENVASFRPHSSSSKYSSPPSFAFDNDQENEGYKITGPCWRADIGDKAPFLQVDFTAVHYIQYVKLSLHNKYPGAGSKNIAVKRPTFGSADRDANSATANAVDDNLETDYTKGSCFSTSAADSWWMVDLQGSYFVNQVVLWGRTDALADMFKDIKVFIYDKNPETDTSATEKVCIQKSAQLTPMVHTCTSPIRVQYVKVTKTTAGELTLCEVQVIAELRDTLRDFQIKVYEYVPGPTSSGKLCYKHEGEVTQETFTAGCYEDIRGRFLRLEGPEPKTADDLMTVCEMAVYVDYVDRLRWSPLDCPRPPYAAFTEVVVTNSSKRAIAKYKCSEGFTRFEGEDTIYCNDKDGWVGRPGSCSRSAYRYRLGVPAHYIWAVFGLGHAFEMMFTPQSDSAKIFLKNKQSKKIILRLVITPRTSTELPGELLIVAGEVKKIAHSPQFQLNHEVKIVVTFLTDSLDIAVNDVYLTSFDHVLDADEISLIDFNAGVVRVVRHLHPSETVGIRGPLLKENLALRKEVKTSSAFMDDTETYKPKHAVDGSLASSGKDGQCWVAAAADMEPFFQIELDGYYYIDHVVITTRSDCTGQCADRVHDVQIEVLHMAPLLKDYRTMCAFREGIIPSGRTETIRCAPGARGRYVRLEGKNRKGDNDMFTLCEVQIYGGKVVRNKLPQDNCPKPPLVPNAEVAVTYTVTKALARYTCHDGYIGCGGGEVLQCRGINGWEGSPWSCVQAVFTEQDDKGLSQVNMPCTFTLGRAIELYFTPTTQSAVLNFMDRDEKIQFLKMSIDAMQKEGGSSGLWVETFSGNVEKASVKSTKSPFQENKEARVVVTFLSTNLDIVVDDHFAIPYDTILKPSTLYSIKSSNGRLRMVRVIPAPDSVGVKSRLNGDITAGVGITASSSASGSDPDSVADKQPATSWTAASDDPNPYLIFQLNKYYYIESVVLATRPCTAPCNDKIYDVLVSVYHDVLPQSPEVCVYHEDVISPDTKTKLNCESDVRGNFIKVEGKNRHKGGDFTFSAIEVYGGLVQREEWNPSKCPKPPFVSNAEVSVSCLETKAIATYTCVEGCARCGVEQFRHQPGSRGIIECRGYGGWEGLPEPCVQHEFPPPSKAGHTFVELPCTFLLEESIGMIFDLKDDRSELVLSTDNGEHLTLAFLPITTTRPTSVIEVQSGSGTTDHTKLTIKDFKFVISSIVKITLTFMTDNFDIVFDNQFAASYKRQIDFPHIDRITPNGGRLLVVKLLPQPKPFAGKSRLSENIALSYDDASSSSTPQAKLPPSAALDDNLNMNFEAGGSCFETDSNDMNPYFLVKLNDYYYIDKMTVWARDCGSLCGERFHDALAEVFYKDPTKNAEPPQICFYRKDPVPGNTFMSFHCDVRGRYVKISSDKRRNAHDRLAFCELQIYGGKISRQLYPPNDCPKPRLLPNAELDVTYTASKAVARYKCIDGYGRCYDHTGSDVMYCTGFGGWTAEPEACVPTTFIEPDISGIPGEELSCLFGLGQALEMFLTPQTDSSNVGLVGGNLLALEMSLYQINGATVLELKAEELTKTLGSVTVENLQYPVGKEIRVVVTFLTGAMAVEIDGAFIAVYDQPTDPSVIKMVQVNNMRLRSIRLVPRSDTTAAARALSESLSTRHEEVTASTNYANPGTPDVVVDGNLAKAWSSGSCWSTAVADMDPFVQIKLDKHYFIDYLEITTRNGDGCAGQCAERAHDVLITVSNLMIDADVPQVCFYREGIIPADSTERIRCHSRLYGRFIKLEGKKRRNDNDLLTFCEINIFGGELIRENAIGPPTIPVDPCPTHLGYISVESPRLCYKLSGKSDTKTFTAAETECKKVGRLIDLDTADKHDHILNVLENMGVEAHDATNSFRVWVGMKEDASGIFKWSSGSTYINKWAVGEPDPSAGQNCIQLLYDGLSDMFCTDSRRYMCEIPMTKSLPSSEEAGPM